MGVIKKFLRDCSSSLLLMVGYCLLFFIAFNGMYLIYRMSEQQPDTVIGNYHYKEGGRILRANKKPGEHTAEETGSGQTLSAEEKVDYVISLLDTKHGNTMIRFVGLVKDSAKSHTVSVMLSQNEPCSRRLQKGSYPDFQKIGQERAAVIGEYYQDYVEKIGGKDYLCINGQNYLVTGVFRSTTEDGLDDSLVLFYPSLEPWVRAELRSYVLSHYIEVVVCGNDSLTKDYIEVLKGTIAEVSFYDWMEMSLDEVSGFNMIIAQIKKVLVWLIALFCVLNSFAVTNLWLKRRQAEFAIRKACGYGNFRIVLLIAKDLLKLMGAAILAAALAQFCYMAALGRTVELWYLFRCCIDTGLLVLAVLISSIVIHIEIVLGTAPAKGVSCQ